MTPSTIQFNILSPLDSVISPVVVVGPNLDKSTRQQYPWSARRQNEGGEKNVPQAAIAICVRGTVPADTYENDNGCTYRILGEFCTLEHIMFSGQTLEPVDFVPTSGIWCNANRARVNLSHLVCMPSGKTLGIVVK